VEDRNTPSKVVQIFPLLVTQSQKASFLVLELDQNYLPTEEKLENISSSPLSETGKGGLSLISLLMISTN
jgi:hypothetical protein